MSLDEITIAYIKAIDAEIEKLTEARNNALKLIGKDISLIEEKPQEVNDEQEFVSPQKKRQEKERREKINKIIELLRNNGELTSSEISERLPLHINTLRKYLKEGPFETHKTGYWRLKVQWTTIQEYWSIYSLSS